jgi:hypothetical protein
MGKNKIMKIFKRHKDNSNKIPLLDYPFIYYPYWLFIIIIIPLVVKLVLTWFFPDINLGNVLSKISAGGVALYISIEILRSVKIYKDYNFDPKNHINDLINMYEKLELLLGALLLYFLHKVFGILG